MTKDTSVRQKTHDGVDKIMDKADNIKDKATEMKTNIDSAISKNPEKSVLIAAGVGAVAGAVLAATMMRKKA